MLVGLVVGAIALGIAYLRGGSVRNLAETRFRGVWLLFAVLAVQLSFGIWDPEDIAPGLGLAIIVVSNGTIVGFLAANRRLPGTLTAAIGLTSNLLVMALNGAMPVSARAAELAGGAGPLEAGIKHEPLGPASELPWLADVIPVPGLHLVLSPGDIVLAAGIAVLVYRRARSVNRLVVTRASG